MAALQLIFVFLFLFLVASHPSVHVDAQAVGVPVVLADGDSAGQSFDGIDQSLDAQPTSASDDGSKPRPACPAVHVCYVIDYPSTLPQYVTLFQAATNLSSAISKLFSKPSPTVLTTTFQAVSYSGIPKTGQSAVTPPDYDLSSFISSFTSDLSISNAESLRQSTTTCTQHLDSKSGSRSLVYVTDKNVTSLAPFVRLMRTVRKTWRSMVVLRVDPLTLSPLYRFETMQPVMLTVSVNRRRLVSGMGAYYRTIDQLVTGSCTILATTPTQSPSPSPYMINTAKPTPSNSPTSSPSNSPMSSPSNSPMSSPSNSPTSSPSNSPTSSPSNSPTSSPSNSPTSSPSNSPMSSPSMTSSTTPTTSPSASVSADPSVLVTPPSSPTSSPSSPSPPASVPASASFSAFATTSNSNTTPAPSIFSPADGGTPAPSVSTTSIPNNPTPEANSSQFNSETPAPSVSVTDPLQDGGSSGNVEPNSGPGSPLTLPIEELSYSIPAVTNAADLPALGANLSPRENALSARAALELFIYEGLVDFYPNALIKTSVTLEPYDTSFRSMRRRWWLYNYNFNPFFRRRRRHGRGVRFNTVAQQQKNSTSVMELGEGIMNVRMSDIRVFCRSNQCAAKVQVWSTNTIRGSLIDRAVNKLRRRDGFRQVFIVRRWLIETNRITGKKWEIVLPYKLSYLNSNDD